MAVQLKLSDRQVGTLLNYSNAIGINFQITQQVKTWFQNRRAKWRRANNGGQTSDSPIDLGTENVSKSIHPATVTSSASSPVDPMKKYSNDYRATSNSKPAEQYDGKSSENYSEHETSSEGEDSSYEDGGASPINVI